MLRRLRPSRLEYRVRTSCVRRMRRRTHTSAFPGQATLIKKKIKFSSYIRKIRVEQLQSHI